MLKRTIDITVSLVLFVALMPLMVLISVAILAMMGHPVLYRQRRPGVKGIPFTLMKFRTMTDLTDGSGSLLPDGRRLTGLGRFLRTTSLDELPQLINVIKGDMSLVGPRPLLVGYLPYYTPREATRHNVRPGITGWAQVNGRNAADWDTRLEMDAWYVENRSLALDAKIVFLTIRNVLSRSGVVVDTSVMADLDIQRTSRRGQ